MKSSIKTENKATWCRSFYGKHLKENGYKIRDIRPCCYGNTCRGAHNITELREKKNITKWRHMDKSKVDILKIKNSIINVLKLSKNKVNNMKYLSGIEQINNMNFIDLINFWFDITCYHRRIYNQLSYNRYNFNPTDGFNVKEDVPLFTLKYEDYVWAMQRSFHMCSKHNYLINNKNKSLSVRYVCCGGINCKEGVHKNEHLACIDDLLYGKCSCLNREECESLNEKNRQIILSYEKQLKSNKDTNGFIKKISRKQKTILYRKITELQNEIKNNIRKIHYTEQGLIPMSQRIIDKEAILAKKKASENNINLSNNKPVKRVRKKYR